MNRTLPLDYFLNKRRKESTVSSLVPKGVLYYTQSMTFGSDEINEGINVGTQRKQKSNQ